MKHEKIDFYGFNWVTVLWLMFNGLVIHLCGSVVGWAYFASFHPDPDIKDIFISFWWITPGFVYLSFFYWQIYLRPSPSYCVSWFYSLGKSPAWFKRDIEEVDDKISTDWIVSLYYSKYPWIPRLWWSL